MYAKKSDEQGPRKRCSFESEEKQLNNEVSSTNDACGICEKPQLKDLAFLVAVLSKGNFKIVNH